MHMMVKILKKTRAIDNSMRDILIIHAVLLSVDVVSSASFHPSSTLLATSSGQRKYELGLESDSDSDDSDSDSEEGPKDLAQTSSTAREPIPSAATTTTIDNSIRMWSMPGAFAWFVNGQRWSETEVGGAGQEQTSLSGDMSMDIMSEETTTVLGTTMHDSSRDPVPGQDHILGQ